MNDFIRPPRPSQVPPRSPEPGQPQQPPQPHYSPVRQATLPSVLPAQQTPMAPPLTPVDMGITSEQPPEPPKKSSKIKKIVLWLLVGLLLIGGLLAGGAWAWYQGELTPVDPNNTERVRVLIEPNTTPSEIATLLKEKQLIRSADAFSLYARISGAQNNLQAGAYRLSPSESTPEIVDHLTKGNVDTIDITFLPGATLEDHKEVFLEAGYSEDEIDAAFTASYDSPLFDGRGPTDLEGYIYGETYRVGSGASVSDILELTFQEFEAALTENNVVAGFQKQGLSLREGLILASIIQKEAGGGDEAQIAQVFLLRKSRGMALGSDVTYQYIADKTGVPRDINLDSPYNTRRYPGLPPGPISSPGLKAILGVANPAPGDYLYFLSGDDDVTYYGRTLEEHEANITNHCREKCQII